MLWGEKNHMLLGLQLDRNCVTPIDEKRAFCFPVAILGEIKRNLKCYLSNSTNEGLFGLKNTFTAAISVLLKHWFYRIFVWYWYTPVVVYVANGKEEVFFSIVYI